MGFTIEAHWLLCTWVMGYGKQHWGVDWKCLGLKPKPHTVKHGPSHEKPSASVGHSSSLSQTSQTLTPSTQRFKHEISHRRATVHEAFLLHRPISRLLHSRFLSSSWIRTNFEQSNPPSFFSIQTYFALEVWRRVEMNPWIVFKKMHELWEKEIEDLPN